jgi:hypothetical protein
MSTAARDRVDRPTIPVRDGISAAPGTDPPPLRDNGETPPSLRDKDETLVDRDETPPPLRNKDETLPDGDEMSPSRPGSDGMPPGRGIGGTPAVEGGVLPRVSGARAVGPRPIGRVRPAVERRPFGPTISEPVVALRRGRPADLREVR